MDGPVRPHAACVGACAKDHGFVKIAPGHFMRCLQAEEHEKAHRRLAAVVGLLFGGMLVWSMMRAEEQQFPNGFSRGCGA